MLKTALPLLALWAVLGPGARADSNQFDLAGPTIEVRVTRKFQTLPIAEVPALAAGDRIWLHPILDPRQSARYIMVTAFLSGAVNRPPDNWFTRVETWDRHVQEEGEYITVPEGAEQAIVFLAPETGGDFSTIRNAVRGRPGAFVRASQDLNVAMIDRARLDTYLAALKTLNTDAPDSAKLKEETAMLARSLSLQPDQKCFDKQSDQQAPCLMQNQDQLVLDNGRGQTTTAALVNGPGGDLALQVGATPQANYGADSSYIEMVLDIARILDGMHTAQYQYIPALAIEKDNAMNLRLNTPPSFHNPKSVLVIALPPIEKPPPVTLHPVDSKQAYCLQKKPLVLPAVGAPSVFATAYLHDLTLHLSPAGKTAAGDAGSGKAGTSLDVAVTPDAVRGGFVAEQGPLSSAGVSGKVTAQVEGMYGFGSYRGPSYSLISAAGDADWKLAPSDNEALVVGRTDELHLVSGPAACVEQVQFSLADGPETTAEFKITKSDEITATLPLKTATPGPVTVKIRQAGLSEASTLKLESLAEAGKVQSFRMHAGDSTGTLTGTRLDEVASLVLSLPGGRSETFVPGALTRSGTTDDLTMTVQSARSAKPGQAAVPAPSAAGSGLSPGPARAGVTLKDGRRLDVAATIETARPRVTLLNRTINSGAGGAPPAALPASTLAASTPGVGGPGALGPIHLADADEMPVNDSVQFALKSATPFERDETIEVATADGLASTTLSPADGSLTLQDARTALATLDPARALGVSAFGPVRFRAVLRDGTTSDWEPLVTLVRLPLLTSFSCPTAAGAGPTTGSPAKRVVRSHGPAGRSAAAASGAAPSPTVVSDASSSSASSVSAAAQACTLSGDRLFLVAAVSTEKNFANAVDVPDGFSGTQLRIPLPAGGNAEAAASADNVAPVPGPQLYLRLRDDPQAVDTVALPPDVPLPAARTVGAGGAVAAAAAPAAAKSEAGAQKDARDAPAGRSGAPDTTGGPGAGAPLAPSASDPAASGASDHVAPTAGSQAVPAVRPPS